MQRPTEGTSAQLIWSNSEVNSKLHLAVEYENVK